MVVLDLDMPGLNGSAIAEKIRALEKEQGLRRTPIIGLTGHDANRVMDDCRNSGMDTVLSKPVSKQLLASTLNDFFL
jgi:CheY-like chemotaxis protein